jgi:hypothetical protein
MSSVDTAKETFDSISDITSYINHYMQQPPQTQQPVLRQVVNANDANAFWLHNGDAIRNIHDLKHAFDIMTQEQFTYHLNQDKNDFALWVQNVLQDNECAEDLTRAKTRLGASRILFKHLKKYNQQARN